MVSHNKILYNLVNYNYDLAIASLIREKINNVLCQQSNVQQFVLFARFF